jgi:PAS domain S-box-containing protein
MSTAAKHTIQEPITSPEAAVKVLLVDDTPENLVALEAALRGIGEQLVLARSGKEALRYLLDDDFAAILLDVKMPDMDGFETAELIRKRPRSLHTPILFLTGYRNEGQLFRGYDLGAVDFLFKPIVPEVLRSKVAVFVELSRNAALLRRQARILREQAEVLQKAELKFRSLLEAAPDAMVMCREDGEIVMVNSQMESLFELQRGNLIGMNIRKLVPRCNLQLARVRDEETGEGFLLRSETGLELDAINADDESFPVEISLSPLQTEEGILITIAIRDITDRKRAEEQIRELNAHLEERVLERTEALMRSNDELQQFAYVASHDLQEPLRTVCVYSQLIEKRFGTRLEPDGHQFLRTVIDSSLRMEQLIRDLLDFSAVDSMGNDFFKPIDCGKVLDESLLNLKSRIEESQAVVTRGPLPVVQGDPIQLTRLFQNLLGNSIKYRSSEPLQIGVSARRDGHEWIFSIQDNGIGIAPQYCEKIFGIFKRLHGKDKYPGNGIGLAVCRKIIVRHGGRIWVESELGAGACFRFTLPGTKP